jgi:hypothetical protein
MTRCSTPVSSACYVSSSPLYVVERRRCSLYTRLFCWREQGSVSTSLISMDGMCKSFNVMRS